MPTFTKLKSGSWRVQVRRKNEYVANTFVRRRDAEEWVLDVASVQSTAAPRSDAPGLLSSLEYFRFDRAAPRRSCAGHAPSRDLPDRMVRCRYDEANCHHSRPQRSEVQGRKPSNRPSPKFDRLCCVADHAGATHSDARSRARISLPLEICWSCVPQVVQRYRYR
jgi:hypothetical protein